MSLHDPSAPITPTRHSPAEPGSTPDHAFRQADKERSLMHALKVPGSGGRAKSEERAGSDKEKDKERKTSAQKPAHKPNGSAFGLGKASKGLFSKLTRSGSGGEKAGFDEEYEPRVLKLPLVEQTRITRIAKTFGSCRDKTEFWMPALPWRCIDYLNGKCEDEGLYRVSGGVANVRKWRRRFDTEYDINLLNETDLYDSSIVASLFKEWIRELPEEILPKETQAKISAALPTEAGQKVPQILRDELSNLPPFNYYLLFAITCHLSLLLSHESQNKMTLDNLYRCFNQSLKLDGRLFYTLVGDWRQCWQGCATESEYLRKEYEYLNQPYPGYPDLDRRPPIKVVQPATDDVAAEPAPEAIPVETETLDHRPHAAE